MDTDDRCVWDLGNKRNESGFIVEANVETSVFYIYDGYKEEFYL